MSHPAIKPALGREVTGIADEQCHGYAVVHNTSPEANSKPAALIVRVDGQNGYGSDRCLLRAGSP